MARQYLISGQGYLNEGGSRQYLVPGQGYVNETSGTTNVTFSGGMPFESLSTSRLDVSARAEAIASPANGLSAPLESTANLNAFGIQFPFESLTTSATVPKAPLENLGGIAFAPPARAEMVAKLVQDILPPSEALTKYSVDAKAPFDYLGTSGFDQFDASLPFEFMSAAGISFTLPAGYLATIADAPVSSPSGYGYGGSEWGYGGYSIPGDGPSGGKLLEALSGIASAPTLLSEFLGSFGFADAMLPLEWASNLTSPANRIFKAPARKSAFRAPVRESVFTAPN